ncbi:MAG: hypothetical protein HON94_05245 [Methylococcales bacterium]|nr:hypothetical protein [Methylococcales bacterium]MBT7410587.1 hypothetical protein [Methylococcales bacterium]
MKIDKTRIREHLIDIDLTCVLYHNKQLTTIPKIIFPNLLYRPLITQKQQPIIFFSE